MSIESKEQKYNLLPDELSHLINSIVYRLENETGYIDRSEDENLPREFSTQRQLEARLAIACNKFEWACEELPYNQYHKYVLDVIGQAIRLYNSLPEYDFRHQEGIDHYNEERIARSE